VKQASRPEHRIGIELIWRRVRQHIVGGDADETPPEFIPGKETTGAGIQDHMLVPRVARRVDEAKAMAPLEIELLIGHRDQEPRVGHRFRQPEICLQFVAEYGPGAGDQPRGIHEMFGAPAVDDHAGGRQV